LIFPKTLHDATCAASKQLKILWNFVPETGCNRISAVTLEEPESLICGKRALKNQTKDFRCRAEAKGGEQGENAGG
jgi:hypothetical protein